MFRCLERRLLGAVAADKRMGKGDADSCVPTPTDRVRDQVPRVSGQLNKTAMARTPAGVRGPFLLQLEQSPSFPALAKCFPFSGR